MFRCARVFVCLVERTDVRLYAIEGLLGVYSREVCTLLLL